MYLFILWDNVHNQPMCEKIPGTDLKITNSRMTRVFPIQGKYMENVGQNPHPGDSQELLFGIQLASDSSALLSDSTVGNTHFTGRFQGSDVRDTEQEQNSA